MHDSTRSRIAVLLALVVGISAVAAGGALGATGVDSETAETTQTSGLTEGSVQTHNETTSTNFSWMADSTSSYVEVTNADGETVATFSPDPYHTNETSGVSYYNVSVADDGSDYPTLDVGAGENASLTYNVYNASDTETANATVNVTYENTETQAIVGVSANDSVIASSNVTVMGYTTSVPLMGGSDAAQVDESTTVTENTSEVVVHIGNASTENAFANAADASSAGAITTLGYVTGPNGATYPMFVESTESVSWLNTSATYATVSTDGSTLTLHNVNDTYDAGSLDFTATGNENLGVWGAYNAAKATGASSQEALGVAYSAGVDVNTDPEWDEIEA